MNKRPEGAAIGLAAAHPGDRNLIAPRKPPWPARSGLS
jgi:hypothetical protein